jgi:hypothetical protein
MSAKSPKPSQKQPSQPPPKVAVVESKSSPKIDITSPKEPTFVPEVVKKPAVIPNNIMKALQATSTAVPKEQSTFSVYVTDDGTKVSTTERVVKGMNFVTRLFDQIIC